MLSTTRVAHVLRVLRALADVLLPVARLLRPLHLPEPVLPPRLLVLPPTRLLLTSMPYR